MKISMQDDEINLLRRFLTKGRTYLEFGMGGSTLAAMDAGVEVLYSVESDPKWIRVVETALDEHPNRSRVDVHLLYADIGETEAWGLPRSSKPESSWSSYFLDVWRHVKRSPDIILVDGRFRTACLLTALMARREDVAIAMHDFFDAMPERRNYQRVLEFCTIQERVSNLVILKPDPNLNYQRALSVLSEVRTDFW